MNRTNILFLDILKTALRGETYTPECEIESAQWELILQTAQEHQVLPMIFEACYRLPGFAGTPMLAAARQQVMRDVFLQTRKTGEFRNLYCSLRAAGITPLVVKGIVCRNLYPQPDYRPSSDEDVLIPEDQFPACHEAMAAFGMEAGETPDHFDKVYEIPYGKRGSPIYIELHKRLFPKDHDAYGELNRFFEGVFQSAVEEQIDGIPILTMAPTDHLFYLVCHAFKHFLHGGFGIRQVCDIVLFSRQYGPRIHWDRVAENCRQIRADGFLAALLAIGAKHLDLEGGAPEDLLPEVDEMPMLEDLLASGIFGSKDEERRHSSSITLGAVASQKQGKDNSHSGSMIRSLFPGVASLEGRYPYLKKHSWLLPVAWICRIFRFLFKKGGADNAAKTIQLGNERIGLLKQYGILDE